MKNHETAGPDRSRRSFWHGIDEIRRPFLEGYHESTDPFGGTLVIQEFSSEALAQQALAGLAVTAGLVYVVAGRRLVLKSVLATLAVTATAEANEGQTLTLTTTGGKTATVAFAGLQGDSFSYKVNSKVFSTSITNFDLASQARIRAAAGLGAPAGSPETQPNGRIGLIPAMAVGTLPDSVEEAQMQRMNRFFQPTLGESMTRRYPNRQPLITAANPSPLSLDLSQASSIFPGDVEMENEEYFILRGQFRTGECQIGNGLNVREFIGYGEHSRFRRGTWTLANKWDLLADGMSERDASSAIKSDYESATRALTEAFGSGIETEYGTGDLVENECLRFRTGTGTSALLFLDNYGVRIVLAPDADIAVEGQFETPSKTTLSAFLRQRVLRNEDGDTIVPGLSAGDQGNTNLCGPSCMARYVAHLQHCRPDMVNVIMRSIAVVSRADASGTSGAGMEAGIRALEKELRMRSQKVNFRKINDYIQRGIPLIWSMMNPGEFTTYSVQHTQARFGGQLQRDLQPQLRFTQGWSPDNAVDLKDRLFADFDRDKTLLTDVASWGHLAMIIGYNESTDEIAFANSEGTGNIYWIPREVAEKISTGGLWPLEP